MLKKVEMIHPDNSSLFSALADMFKKPVLSDKVELVGVNGFKLCTMKEAITIHSDVRSLNILRDVFQRR